ncbi:hypothetical protein L3X38_032582 [Prunus dulcis]|uniref:Uncharacterized protein n=1 Tax=Prunus dulcis TaxID=3755 RepID=A0AAD4VEE3_PRUDU|nr:hypothetical protein L3X38_032582 [Prunus dulcis]
MLVSSPTEAEYERHLLALQTNFKDHNFVINYEKERWLIPYKERFVAVFVQISHKIIFTLDSSPFELPSLSYCETNRSKRPHSRGVGQRWISGTIVRPCAVKLLQPRGRVVATRGLLAQD